MILLMLLLLDGNNTWFAGIVLAKGECDLDVRIRRSLIACRQKIMGGRLELHLWKLLAEFRDFFGKTTNTTHTACHLALCTY
jgi:hypothetical protein